MNKKYIAIAAIAVIIASFGLVFANGLGNNTTGNVVDTEHMDADNDGICDMCGMPIELCEGMTDHMHGDIDEHMEMHSMMHGTESAMGCHK